MHPLGPQPTNFSLLRLFLAVAAAGLALGFGQGVRSIFTPILAVALAGIVLTVRKSDIPGIFFTATGSLLGVSLTAALNQSAGSPYLYDVSSAILGGSFGGILTMVLVRVIRWTDHF